MNHIVEVSRQGGTLTVKLNGKGVTPAKSLKVINHSPTGFETGYAGSGPAQLALAVLLEVVGKNNAVRYHQGFKFKFVSPLVVAEGETKSFEFDDAPYLQVRKASDDCHTYS